MELLNKNNTVLQNFINYYTNVKLQFMKSPITVYKPTYSHYKEWLFQNQEMTDGSRVSCNVGSIVYEILNRIVTMKNEVVFKDFTKSDKVTLVDKKEKWKTDALKLLNIISNREKYSLRERLNVYEKYKSFAFFYLSDTEKIDGHTAFLYYNDNIDSSPLWIFNDKYIVIPNSQTSTDEQYDEITAFDFSGFFALDLREILFNPNCILSVNLCPICHELFLTDNRVVRYCKECREDLKIYTTNRNMLYLLDKANKLHKLIYDMLRRRSYVDIQYDKILDIFINESNYYKKVIKNKKADYNPNYDNSIKTREDYIKWLEAKHAYFKKNYTRARRNDHGVKRKNNE